MIIWQFLTSFLLAFNISLAHLFSPLTHTASLTFLKSNGKSGCVRHSLPAIAQNDTIMIYHLELNFDFKRKSRNTTSVFQRALNNGTLKTFLSFSCAREFWHAHSRITPWKIQSLLVVMSVTIILKEATRIIQRHPRYATAFLSLRHKKRQVASHQNVENLQQQQPTFPHPNSQFNFTSLHSI